MAINLRGLPIVPGARTLTSGGPPIALNNEIRGGIHRISGLSGDQLGDIDARYLQVGMLVYDETQDTYYMYKNNNIDPPSDNPDSNDPYRGADGRLPNVIGVIGSNGSNWIEFRSAPEMLSEIDNVHITSPAAGQVLEYSTDADGQGNPGWINSTDNPQGNSIESLSDVEADGRPGGSVLQFNADPAAMRWEDALLALTSLSDVSADIANAEVGDGFGFGDDPNDPGTMRWIRRPRATPSYPNDQLRVRDPQNPGPDDNPNFLTSRFLYELRVDIDNAGNRVVTWMETPGTVDFTFQARPDVDEGETAFRRAPSEYVLIGYGDGVIDPATGTPYPNEDTRVLQSDFSIGNIDLGPMIWGQPNPASSTLRTIFGTQPVLWFIGDDAGDGNFFIRQAGTTTPLEGDVIHISIDYNGFVRDTSTGDPTTVLASASPELEPLRNAIPPGEYTAEIFRGLTASSNFLSYAIVGVTELRNMDGVLHRVPEPPNPDGQGIFFGVGNPDTTPNPTPMTNTRFGTTIPAELIETDPLFVFEHGGTVSEGSVAGSDFVTTTRIAANTGDNPTPYDRIRIEADEIGVAGVSNAGTAVANSNNVGRRAEGRQGHNRFPTISAGTGIELRSTVDDQLQIVNTFQEQDADTAFARTTQSLARDGGVLTQEYVRGNSSTNTTDFFRPSGGSNGIDYETSLTYGRTPGSSNNGQLIFRFLVTPRGTPSPYSPTDIVRLRIGTGVDAALVTAGLVPGDYTAVVTAVGSEESGPTAALGAYQITLDAIKRQSGGLALEGPATTITVAAANIEENDIEVSGLTLTGTDNLDNFDPFLLVQHSPNEAENSAIRFVGGNEISVEQTELGVITINNTGGIPLFQQQHQYQEGDVFYTNNDATLIPTPGDRNKVFRVQTRFMSGVDLSTLNALNIIPIGDGSPGRAYYQFPDQRTLSYTNVTLRGGDIIDVYDAQPTPDPNDPDTLIPATRTGSYMYSGTIDDPAGRFTDFPLELNTGIAPTPAGLAQNFIPFVTDQAALEFLTTETDGISGVDFHDGFTIDTTAQRDASTQLRRGTQYSTGATSMLEDGDPIGGRAANLMINNLQNFPAVTADSVFWLNIPSGLWAGDYQVSPSGPDDAGETEDLFDNRLIPIIGNTLQPGSTVQLTEGDLPINGVGLFEFVEEDIPAVQPRLNLNTVDNGTYQFTPQGMTLASGGFLLRTESSSGTSQQVSQTGDIALDSDGQETLQLFGNGWNVNFNPARSNPIDMTTFSEGDAVIMRATMGNTARSTEFRELVGAGDYLIHVGAPSPNANTLILNNNTLRRINADGSLQNHVGGAEELAVFSLPFPAGSLTFFRAHYESEFQVSTTNNTTEIGFNDRGLRTNGVVDIRGNFLSSDTRIDNIGTNIDAIYPAAWQFGYFGSTAIFQIVSPGGAEDFFSIKVGDRFLITTDVADNDGHLPAGRYYAIRTNNNAASGSDRTIWFDPTQIYTINADNTVGDRVPLNGIIPVYQDTNQYRFATVNVTPEVRVNLHDGTFYEFENDNLYITPAGGTRTAVGGGGSIDGSGTAGQLARWMDGDTLEGVALNNLWPSASRDDNDELIPSAQYVLNATDYEPVFEVPTTTLNLVANQQYFVHINAPNGIRLAEDRLRVSLRDFRINGQNATTVQYWNELTDTWVDLSVFDNTSAATMLSSTQPLDSTGNNLFRITFNAAARSNMVDNAAVVEEATVALRNSTGAAIVGGTKHGITVGVDGYLPNSGVVANTYTNADITVNAQGIITAATNGSSSGGGRLPYPSTGGFAADDLGQVTHGASDVISWPSRSSLVQGIQGITYTAQTGGAGASSATDVIGYFTNNTGGEINLTSGRIDVDITIDSINAAGIMQIVVRRATTNTGSSFASMSQTVSGEGVVEFSDTSLGDTNAIWRDGEVLGFHIASTSSARPFTYTVNDVRVSTTPSQFVRQSIVSAFTGLDDTPENYTGSGGQLVAVNSGATALEFTPAPVPFREGLEGQSGIGGLVSAPGPNEGMQFLRGDNTFHPVLTEVPLHAKVNRLFLGTAGTMQTNGRVEGILANFNYTPYTVYEGPTGNYDATFENTYYFIEGVSIAISGTGDRVFSTANTDGVWTSDDPAQGVLTTANAVNLIG